MPATKAKTVRNRSMANLQVVDLAIVCSALFNVE
jgi:hypothetical protein